jgi:hypothetical protein
VENVPLNTRDKNTALSPCNSKTFQKYHPHSDHGSGYDGSGDSDIPSNSNPSPKNYPRYDGSGYDGDDSDVASNSDPDTHSDCDLVNGSSANLTGRGDSARPPKSPLALKADLGAKKAKLREILDHETWMAEEHVLVLLFLTMNIVSSTVAPTGFHFRLG